MNRFRQAGISIALFLFVLCSIGPSVQAADLEHGLALREIFEYQRWPDVYRFLKKDYQRDTATLQSLTRLWLKKKTGQVTGKLEIEANALFQTIPITGTTIGGWSDQNPGQSRIGFWNLTKKLRSREKGEISASVERADLTWSCGSLDFDAGRQPISLGTSHFIGLLDVLAPFHPGYLDASYKPGIDALRVRTGFGTSGEAEIIAVPGGSNSNGALLGRFRKNVQGFDLELISGRFRGRTMAGLGYDGEKRKITYWGELVLFEHDLNRETLRGGNSRWALSFITGVEKEISPKLRMGAAFLHQDFGAGHSDQLASVYADAPYREGWTFLGGRSYGLLTLNKEFTPLIKGDVSGMFNLVDGSTLWQPKLTFNTSDNSDIAVFAWLSSGSAPATRFVPMVGATLYTPSEFGLFPAGIGIIARRFF